MDTVAPEAWSGALPERADSLDLGGSDTNPGTKNWRHTFCNYEEREAWKQ
jgi:hypothetical protein